ncbi:MAG: NAD(P)-dependent oxidoreductase [Deltaproteobacteria bacterium]|nr:NAD(P)-dependent oxidoreductase [Deltaproteobacteria bacterium]
MTKRVLVTGGAGYLGSVLCEHLLDAGYQVTALDNLMYGQKSLFHLLANPNLDFVFGDTRDEELMKELVAGTDVIIPLAAVVGAPACARDPWLAESVNDGVRLVLRLSNPQQLIVYPTTNSGYGTKSGDVFCTEETPLEPISIYGVDKVELEREVLENKNAITLRLATVFGLSPRLRRDLLVNHFTWMAASDGTIVIFEKDFKRNYIHVRDVADCFIHCIVSGDKMVGRPFNAGLDEANLSKEELALKIKEYIPGFYIHFAEVGSDPDKRNYIVSNARLREFGFEAKRSLDMGIKELIKGYRMMVRHPFMNV